MKTSMKDTLLILISRFSERIDISCLSLQSNFEHIKKEILNSCAYREISFDDSDFLIKELKKVFAEKSARFCTSEKVLTELKSCIDLFDLKNFFSLDDLHIGFNYVVDEEISSAHLFNLLSNADRQLLMNMVELSLLKKLSYFKLIQLKRFKLTCQDVDFLKFVEKQISLFELKNEQKLSKNQRKGTGSEQEINTPLLNDGRFSPFSNTGEKLPSGMVFDLAKYQKLSEFANCVPISVNGKTVPAFAGAKVDKSICKFDWVRYGCCISTLSKGADLISTHDEEKITSVIELYIPEYLDKIFGLELGERCSPMNNYKYVWKIAGDCGHVFSGHTGGSKRILIDITGKGCTLAKPRWNKRLYDFLTKSKGGKINRLDICLDDLTGEYFDVDFLDELDTKGLFKSGGRQPKINKLGDWKYGDSAGRTFNVGKRGGSKVHRGYERGKKLGDSFSNWTRSEVEFLASHAFLPFDMLLNPDSYFAGAYPACALLLELMDSVDIEQQRIELIKKESQITLEKSFDIHRHQFGAYIAFYRTFMDDKDILDRIERKPKGKKVEPPKRVQFSSYAAYILAKNDEAILPDSFKTVSFSNKPSVSLHC